MSGRPQAFVALLCLGAHACGSVETPAPVARPSDVAERFYALAAGESHACAVRGDGSVWCWGDNSHGQAGGGEGVDDVRAPARVAGIDDAADVSAGLRHTCVLRRGGRVSCFGDNERAQCGQPRQRTYYAPAELPGVVGVVELSAGRWHTCARHSSGRVLCWGDNRRHQLDAEGEAIPSPVELFENVEQVATGREHTCALRGGAVTCVLGAPPEPVTDAEGIFAGAGFSCALRRGAPPQCWGRGILGTPDHIDRLAPEASIALPNGAADLVSLALAEDHSCGRNADGVVRCWGRRREGQWGGFPPAGDEVGVAHGLDDAVDVVSGRWFSCALRSSGRVACWGMDFDGRLGVGSAAEVDLDTDRAPTRADALDGLRDLELGAYHGCGIREGRVRCWGDNTFGQLGARLEATPPNVHEIEAVGDAVDLALGHDHTCVLHRSGSVSCFGRNDVAQLGRGRSSAVEGIGPVSRLDDAVEIAASPGGHMTCARTRAGEVRCWGGGWGSPYATPSGAQLRVFQNRPHVYEGVGDVRELEVLRDHACGRTDSGEVTCWGFTGQMRDWLGTGERGAAELPELEGATSFARARWTCILDAEGSVACRGFSRAGRSRQPSFEPIALPGPAVQVEAMADRACARLADGSVHCWRDASQSDWSPASMTAAEPLEGISEAEELALGTDAGCARTATGAVWCFGRGIQGQLGSPSRLVRRTPTPIAMPDR